MAVKIGQDKSNGRIYRLWQIVDYASPDPKVAASVAVGHELKANKLQFLTVSPKPLIDDMMLDMRKHPKVMAIIDISQFPFIAVSYDTEEESLIKDDSQFSKDTLKAWREFNWAKNRIPLIYVNIKIPHTGLCIYDFEQGRFIKE